MGAVKYMCNCWHHGWNAAYIQADVNDCLNRLEDAMGALASPA